MKNSKVFVTPVKNSYEYFTRVKNSYEFVTRVTDLLEFESRTNLSHVKNSNVFVTSEKNFCEFFTRVANTFEFFTRLKSDICEEFVPVLKISKLVVRICHTCQNVTYSCEFFTGVTNTYAWCVTNSSQTGVCHAIIFVRSVQIPLKFIMQILYPIPRIESTNLYARQDNNHWSGHKKRWSIIATSLGQVLIVVHSMHSLDTWSRC